MRARVLATLGMVLSVSTAPTEGGEEIFFGPYGGYGVNALVIDSRSPSTMFAATRTTGLFKSTDNGVTWLDVWTSPHATGEGVTVGVDPVVDDLVIDLHGEGRLYMLAAGEGILRSDSSGEGWTKVDAPLSSSPGQRPFLDVDPSSPGVLLVGSEADGILRSTDNGSTWTTVLSEPISGVARSPDRPEIMYSVSVLNSSLFRSDDGGQTWAQIGTELPDLWRLQEIVVRPSQPDMLYLAGAVLHEIDDGSEIGGAVLMSQNSGLTWSQIFAQEDTWIWSLAIDPTNPDVIYAGSSGKIHVPGLFRTIDSGQTWAMVASDPVATIGLHPNDPGVVYAGIPSGMGGIVRFTFDDQSTAVRSASWGLIKRNLNE